MPVSESWVSLYVDWGRERGDSSVAESVNDSWMIWMMGEFNVG